MTDGATGTALRFGNISYMTRTNSVTGQMLPHEDKRKVFISYTHADEKNLPLCKQLAEIILKDLDVAIWYDSELTAGAEYDAEIQQAIVTSDAFVLLLTPNILNSRYVFDMEIPLAKKNQVPIIPVIAGISDESIPQIEQQVGRIHMPLWFFGAKEQVPAFHAEGKKQLLDGLQLCIAGKDLLNQAELFYAKGTDKLSLRHLNPEQMFIKAYGYLYHVIPDGDKKLGVKLLQSILNIYDMDADFADLQEQAAGELIHHFYRVNEPELFCAYAKPAAQKGNRKILALLLQVYGNQWNPEYLREQPELSFLLFEDLYQRNFGKVWDAEAVLASGTGETVQPTMHTDSGFPHVGELCWDNHCAYFQKSSTEPRTVNRIVDEKKIASFDVYASCGDVYTLYLAYDPSRKLLITLNADFDHYGSETFISGKIYKVEGTQIKACGFQSDWLRGLRKLPYTPYTFRMN